LIQSTNSSREAISALSSSIRFMRESTEFICGEFDYGKKIFRFFMIGIDTREIRSGEIRSARAG
jgi:hypothetical protein